MKTISIIFNQQKDWNLDLGSDLTAVYFGLTGCVAMHVTERLQTILCVCIQLLSITCSLFLPSNALLNVF